MSDIHPRTFYIWAVV